MAIPHQACTVDGCKKNAHWKAKGVRGWCFSHYCRWRKHGDPEAGGVTPGSCLAWIEEHASYTGDDCLPWPFKSKVRGYGRVAHKGKLRSASRVMCEIVHGLPPQEDMHAAHNCGNGHLGCMNPKHIRWATPVENAADKAEHGTDARGSQMPFAKLTESDVREIRASPLSSRIVAEKYNVDPAHIRLIRRGKIWKHVE